MIVYKVTNRINGKVYIGQTKRTLQRRWRQHCNPNCISCLSLHRAIMKYGSENFTVEQIGVACSKEELDAKEIYWIKFYDSMNPEKGYNLVLGNNQKHISNEARKNKGNGMRGKKHTMETRKRMSEAHKGIKQTKESLSKSVETKRKNGTYDKIAKIAPLNGRKSSKQVMCVETGKIYSSITEAAKLHGGDRTNLSACVRGKSKTFRSFHWKYV